MINTVKLHLYIDNKMKEQLQDYGRLMRHEIYKIAGVFQKEQRIFAFPYRSISNLISTDNKPCVIKQAEILYHIRSRTPYEKLSFSSIWSFQSCCIQEHQLRLQPGSYSHNQIWDISFTIVKNKEGTLMTGKVIDVTIMEQNAIWFAYVRLNTFQ